jgi:hypothetical protein
MSASSSTSARSRLGVALGRWLGGQRGRLFSPRAHVAALIAGDLAAPVVKRDPAQFVPPQLGHSIIAASSGSVAALSNRNGGSDTQSWKLSSSRNIGSTAGPRRSTTMDPW